MGSGLDLKLLKEALGSLGRVTENIALREGGLPYVFANAAWMLLSLAVDLQKGEPWTTTRTRYLVRTFMQITVTLMLERLPWADHLSPEALAAHRKELDAAVEAIVANVTTIQATDAAMHHDRIFWELIKDIERLLARARWTRPVL